MIDMKLLRENNRGYKLIKSQPFKNEAEDYLFVVLGRWHDELCCHIYNTTDNVLSDGKYSNPVKDYDKRIESYC